MELDIEIQPIDNQNDSQDDEPNNSSDSGIETDKLSVEKCRQMFKEDVDAAFDERETMRRSFDYYFGPGQWDNDEINALDEQKRPAFTVNRIKPLINRVSGFQRLNRYEPTFVPTNNADPQLCEISKAATKWIFSKNDYDTVESLVALKMLIGGTGWFYSSYEWDCSIRKARIKIQEVSPFDMYIDCTSRKPDCSDAQRMHYARWVDKGEAKLHYPEKAKEIDAWTRRFDVDEDQIEEDADLWYQYDTNKIRMVETWWKEYGDYPYALLPDGNLIPAKDLTPEQEPLVVELRNLPGYQMMYCAYLGDVVLEDVRPSWYEHNEFPFDRVVAYHVGEGDYPTGIVADLFDVQDEINKRRSQNMHTVNTQSNSGWLVEKGSLSEAQEEELEMFGATPGVVLTYRAGRPAPQRITPAPLAAPIIEAENAATQDIYSLSNINPQEMMTQPMQTPESGRAIELKQRIGHAGINMLFDNLRATKKNLLRKLWGNGELKGLMQQYLTDKMTLRIVDDSGKHQVIPINQKIVIPDPFLGEIHRTLNDVSIFSFDVDIASVPITPTHRQSQFWSLVDACAQMGIPGELVFPYILDLSDIPQREEIKQQWLQRQQMQQQMLMQQAQMKQKPQQPRVSISYKGELPPAEQMQAAAKLAGLQPQPQDYGLPAPPPPTPQQIAAQALLNSGMMNRPAPPPGNILTGNPVAVRNPALVRQQYLSNRPTHPSTRPVTPLAKEARGM